MDLASAVLRAGPQCASPVALAAGLATLEALDAEIYQQLEAAGQTLEEELAGALSYHGCSLGRVGSMFTVFYRETLPRNAAEARECDIDAFESFHCAALGGGVYLPPGQLETAFLPVVLGDRQLAMAIEGITAAMVAAEA